MRRECFFLLMAIVVTNCTLFADEVMLTNGNHLTGTIVKLDSEKLVLQTDFADSINIKWNAVASFTAEKPVVLQTATEKLNAVGVVRSDTSLQVTRPDAAPITIPASTLTALRSQGEQATYEQSLHPGVLTGWTGGVNFGLGLARGNSETTNLATGIDLARATLNDKTTLKFATIYSNDNLSGQTTANSILAGIRYDHNISKRLFGFVSADFETNDLQDLDLRTILGGGLGYHLINTSNTTLDLLGGGAWTHESYSTGITNSIFSPSIGEDFSHKFSERTTFKASAFLYPYVTGDQAGDYRFAFDAGLSTKISRWLSWQTTVSDRYISNPPLATKNNDLLLSTGLAVTLPAGAK